MSIIMSWEAEEHFFGDSAFGSTALPSAFYIRLFSNNIQPAKSNVFADFTQATTPDTDEFTLTRTAFVITAGTASNKSNAEYPSSVTFEFTGYAGTEDYIYGYLIRWNDGGTNRVLVSEKFDTPLLVSTALTVVIKPKIEFGELVE